MSGTLYGVGLGPGDPELVTLKALRIMRMADVIAYPVPDSGVSLARAIAEPHLSGAQAELPMPLCMRVERAPGQAGYDAAAAAIEAPLAQGQNVALLCEGDPFFYGSFLYVFERLAARFQVEIVPGISSVMAGAAAIRQPLARRNETVSIIPAPLPDAELRQRLSACDAFSIIKLGRHLPRVRALLDEMGLTAGCSYLAHVSQAGERLCPLAEADATAPYFSMILGHHAEAA